MRPQQASVARPLLDMRASRFHDGPGWRYPPLYVQYLLPLPPYHRTLRILFDELVICTYRPVYLHRPIYYTTNTTKVTASVSCLTDLHWPNLQYDDAQSFPRPLILRAMIDKPISRRTFYVGLDLGPSIT